MNTDLQILRKLAQVEALLQKKWNLKASPHFTINFDDKELKVKWDNYTKAEGTSNRT